MIDYDVFMICDGMTPTKYELYVREGVEPTSTRSLTDPGMLMMFAGCQ
jgi:hypothetical protein